MRATSWFRSSAPRRPVMFPTSMRQPSRLKGSCSQRATTESSSRMKRSRNAAEFQLNFGSEGTPSQDTYSPWSSLK